MRRLVLLSAVLATTALADDSATILVARRDLPAGAKLERKDVQQVTVEARWATLSIVRADSAQYVFDQPLRFPVLEGDPILWAFFEASPPESTCTALFPKEEAAAHQVARHKAAVLPPAKR